MKAAIALSVLFSGAALADVAPSPPVDPIPETCKPFIGIWQRTTPEVGRSMAAWTILVIDSSRVTMLYYVDEGSGVNVQAQTGLFNIGCEPAEGGVTNLAFSTATDEEGEFGMEVKLSGDSFTSTEQSSYNEPGPPPADWKPETVTVTWKRIVP